MTASCAEDYFRGGGGGTLTDVGGTLPPLMTGSGRGKGAGRESVEAMRITSFGVGATAIGQREISLRLALRFIVNFHFLWK